MKKLIASNKPLVKIVALTAVLLVVGLTPLPRESVELRVASKKFTESVILGDLLELLAESRGINTAHYAELIGTQTVFKSLANGQIDAYPEYTGTLAQEIFADRDIPSDEALRAELNKLGLKMSAPLGFNNTYALALTRKRAEELDVSRISDLRRFPELKVAVTHEFLDRGDGWPALVQNYDLPQTNVLGVDHDIAYRQLLSGEVDVIDVYTTDAKIGQSDLRVLEDDLQFFPRYDAVWLYRQELDSDYPQFVEAMQQVEGALSESAIQALNAAVEERRMTAAQAAGDFLDRKLGVSVQAVSESWGQVVARHLIEHLNLVRRSLIPAIVVGIALGVFCQRRPRIGSGVLAVVGLLQTIPSLALLVLLLPIVAALGYQNLGEGSVTAIVALFCYCLLPIVRNTYTGIDGIQRGTIESATVLGLNRTSRLLEIELPIALPTILAGVRTAGVQNVGFATLGAIIGAGGLGQLILRGIRINDTTLILAGAVPAAVLALALQFAIDALEWAVVPRGLKRGRSAHD